MYTVTWRDIKLVCVYYDLVRYQVSVYTVTWRDIRLVCVYCDLARYQVSVCIL